MMSAFDVPLRRSLLTGVALLMTATAAGAQNTAVTPADGAAPQQAATADQLADIIVTAQRRSEALQTVPIAISAFDQTAIDRLKSRDLTTLTGQVPNLTLSEVSIGPGLAQISIRGVNSQDPEKSFDPAVGVFIDGVYLGSSAFNLLNTADLERIEVLRGPQGTLFGRNTTGGAISATRRRPTGELGFRGSVTVGNYGRNDYQGEANLPGGDLVSFLVRGQLQRDNGMYANPAGGATGAKDRWSAGGAMRLKDSGVVDITLAYDHAEDHSQLTPYFPAGVAATEILPLTITQTTYPTPATVVPGFARDPLCVAGGLCYNQTTTITDPHRQNSRLDAVTLNGDVKLSNDLTLTTVIGWRRSLENVYIDFDGTSRTEFDVVRSQNYSQYSGELRLASSFAGPFNFVAGVYHFHSQYELRQAVKLDLALAGVPVPLGTLYSNGSGDQDDHVAITSAVFAQGDYKITDRLKLTVGGRLTRDHKQIYTYFFGAPYGTTATYSVADGVPANRPITSQGGATVHFLEFTPKAMLTFQASPTMLFYGSFTRGYNAGGFSARAGTVADVTTPFRPEFINAYEVGAKLDLLERRLRVNAAAFWNDYSDKQEDTIQPAPAPAFTSTTVRNVSAARIRGLELEVSALPVRSLRLDGALGYLDARYTSFNTYLGSGQYVSTPAQPSGTLLTADLSNLHLRRAPKWSGSAGATYTADLDAGTLQLNGQVRFVSAQYTEFFNSPRGRIPAYADENASISFSFGGPRRDRYTLTAFVENLSDERHIESFTNSVVDFSTLNRPRQIGGKLAVNF